VITVLRSAAGLPPHSGHSSVVSGGLANASFLRGRAHAMLDQNDDIWRRLKFHLFMRAFLSYILKERSK